jgi:hypothetical protein
MNRTIVTLGLLLSAFAIFPVPTHALEPQPRGDVFVPLFADPKEIRSTVDYLWTSSEGHKTAIVLVGFGEHWGLVRWEGKRPNEGWQFGITGGLFAQFDMHTPSKDLLNADYLVGFPLSWRLNNTSARFRVYHQSSHLGDEYILADHPTRVNLSWEALDLIVSQDYGRFRLYGGGEWLFSRNPSELKPMVYHAGVEMRCPLGVFHRSPMRRAQWLLCVDAKNTQERWGGLGLSIVTGVEFGPTLESDKDGRRWSLTINHYHGPSPYSQYFYESVTYNGLGFQLGI